MNTPEDAAVKKKSREQITLTPEQWLEAVKERGTALKDVPEELKTPELCLAAVQDRGYALKYVPEALRTTEFCLAIRRDAEALQFVPTHLKTAEFWLAYVQKDGLALVDVPEDRKTAEVCFAAVLECGWALKYVPETLKTPELYLAAVEQLQLPHDVIASVIGGNEESLYTEATNFVREQGEVSIFLIQQRFHIGLNEAARFVEQMKQDGIILLGDR